MNFVGYEVKESALNLGEIVVYKEEKVLKYF